MLFFKTASLVNLTRLFAEKLADSEEIKQYCTDHYKKEQIVFLGTDLKQPPSEDTCPYIVVVPGEKQEGLTQKQFTYVVDIMWCISNKEITKDKLVEFVGMDEADNLGQLILNTVVNSLKNSVVNQIDYSVNGLTEYPQFPGQMSLTINVPHVIGTERVEF
ncbi:MAG: hypothetical protein ACLRPD_11670 [Megamonas funiformis]|uniref:hypothetical protein n=1 Tax=Megamonas funiformis TaxID=437897 RepID=UPI003990896A